MSVRYVGEPVPPPGPRDRTLTLASSAWFEPWATAPGRLRVDGVRLARADGDAVRPIAASGFDLPERIGRHGDLRFADWLVAEGFNYVRVVPSSVYRSPRTIAEGLAWLPQTLEVCRDRGLYVQVVGAVDTGPEGYDLNRDGVREWMRELGQICHDYANTLMDVNEPYHGTQQPWLAAPEFLQELRAEVPSAVPMTLGSSHEGLLLTGGDWTAIHADRVKSPEEQAAFVASVQAETEKLAWNDEPNAISETETRPSDRTDPAWATRLAAAHRSSGVPVTLHLRWAGLTANVDDLGPVQREAARRFVEVLTGE